MAVVVVVVMIVGGGGISGEVRGGSPSTLVEKFQGLVMLALEVLH